MLARRASNALVGVDGRVHLLRSLGDTLRTRKDVFGPDARLGALLDYLSAQASDNKLPAANILQGNQHKPNYLGVPSVAFTIPPIASVGLGEKQAREQGMKFRVRHRKAADWYTARRVGETVYGFKVIVEEGSERILGAHLIGPHVDEVINIFALAIRNNLTANDLKATMFADPTGASDISHML